LRELRSLRQRRLGRRRKQRKLAGGRISIGRRGAGGGLPESGKATALAKTDDAFAGGANVGFDSGVVDFFERAASVAGERQKAHLAFEIADGWKLDSPKIQFRIDERNTVGVNAVVAAKLADHADFRFFVAFGAAKDELLLGREFVFGEDAGAVQAEKNGFGALRKDFAVQIVADQDDGNFLRDAAAAAHNL